MADQAKSRDRALRKLLSSVFEEKKYTLYYLCLGMTGSPDLAEALVIQALEEVRTKPAGEALPDAEALGRQLIQTALRLCTDSGMEAEAGTDIDLPFWYALDAEQKPLFVLHYLADMDTKEISEYLNQPLRRTAGACTNIDNRLSAVIEDSFGVDCGRGAAVPIHIRQRIVLEQNDQPIPVGIDQEAARVLSAKNAPAGSGGQKSGKKKWLILAACAAVCVIAVIAVLVVTSNTASAVNADYYAEIEIEDYGTITVALDAEAAPETVANFVSLAESGFYDGLTFHRIIEGFMMQGGDPNGDGTGGSDETIVGEFSDNGYENSLSHTRGAISMARGDDYDSASSQFFIVQEDSTYLDGSYAVFGYVTDGMEIVDTICEEAEPTDDNGTIDAEDQPVITSITIYTAEEYEAA